MISNQIAMSVTIDGVKSFPVNAATLTHSGNTPFPVAYLTVGSRNYVFINEHFASKDTDPGSYKLPAVTLDITVKDGTEYRFEGVITALTGTESETGLTNSVTVMPQAYYASILTASIDMTGPLFAAYLSDAIQLCNDLIKYFNLNKFNTLALTPALTLLPIVMPQTYKKLIIAPRFINMTLLSMLEAIVAPYGYSVTFTWDSQVMAGSLNNPIASKIAVTQDVLKGDSFSNDVLLSRLSTKLSW